MAGKQRILRRLNVVKADLEQAEKTNSKEALNNVSQMLIKARDICRHGLSEINYAAYGEVYDGLITASRQMAESEEASFDKEALSLCQEILQYLIRETEKETKFKKDIFFLPYKASMWDSLESVWKAAYEDKEHCNAYVMPIPYAELNPDRSVAEWLCESYQFPEYVPIVDWQQTDIKAWHPDVIFFHNPYDNLNRVTSVESRFYSQNLRECTDKLVYVPYFVFDDNCSEDDVRNFALSLGVINSDRIIVQSESIREKYIRVLTKETKQTNRSYWEKRILGLGSPKIDKVLHSRRDDFELPSRWEATMNGRKIILYITSLTPMLENTDKICIKLKKVFDIFKKQKDVLLWWRPHPLMKASIHSMRPQIEKEYLQIEKDYIKEGWGIYDDTGDLHRAIAFSDAYYGDGSSVHKLYSRTHKPILIQQYEEIEKIKNSFRQKYKEENIPENFNSGLVMEGEPFDIYDLIETVKNSKYKNAVIEPTERPKWNLIWSEEKS